MLGKNFGGIATLRIRVGQKSAKWPARVAPFLSKAIYKPFGGRFEALAVSQTICPAKTEMLRVVPWDHMPSLFGRLGSETAGLGLANFQLFPSSPW